MVISVKTLQFIFTELVKRGIDELINDGNKDVLFGPYTVFERVQSMLEIIGNGAVGELRESKKGIRYISNEVAGYKKYMQRE